MNEWKENGMRSNCRKLQLNTYHTILIISCERRAMMSDVDDDDDGDSE